MNSRERAALDRVDDVIHEIGTMTPSNHADIAAISRNLRLVTSASKALTRGISAIRRQDWPAVDEHLKDAERIVMRPGVPDRTAGR